VRSRPAFGSEAAAAHRATPARFARVLEPADRERFDRASFVLPADLVRAVLYYAGVRIPARRDAAERLGQSTIARSRRVRALGIARRRIAATLLWESAWLVGAGGLLSLPVGGALALAFDRILRTMPGLPDRLHFFVFDRSTIAMHLSLLVATAVGASLYPVWVATRLPIAATLRQETS